jgi:hypothetical protein
MARLAQPEINCSICNKPVDLETAKTDADGKTVHGECYVAAMGLKRPRQNIERLQISSRNPQNP